MKRTFRTGLVQLGLLTLSLSSTAIAMDHSTHLSDSHQVRHEERKTKKLDEMTNELHLTTMQRSQVHNLMQDKHSKIQALRNEYKGKEKDATYKKRKVAILEDYNDEIHKILTPEQRQSYDKWLSERKSLMNEKQKHSMREMEE